MSGAKWHKGPPPSIGWWPASVWGYRDPEYIGWFDGECWSAFAHMSCDAEEAADQAKRRGALQDVEWTERPASWPARSRT